MSLQFRIAIPMMDTSLDDIKRALFDVARSQPNRDISVQRANVMRKRKAPGCVRPELDACAVRCRQYCACVRGRYYS